jgi:hypothetical protein
MYTQRCILLGFPGAWQHLYLARRKENLTLTSSVLLIYFPTVNALEIFCQLFGSQSVS